MNRPPVLCLETGGTIASSSGRNGRAPNRSVVDLIDEKAPWVRDLAAVTAPAAGSPHHFGPLIDSTNADFIHWSRISELIVSHTKARGTRGVVVTHGTDTLSYAAGALAFLLAEIRIPVVITASMRGFDQEESDAAGNLTDAIYAATKLPGGVYIVLQGDIQDPVRLRKYSSSALSAFHTVNAPILGSVSWLRGHCRVNGKPVRLKGIVSGTTGADPFSPEVVSLRLAPGATAEWLDRNLGHSGVRGAVIEGFGLGGVPENLLGVLERHTRAKEIVVSTQCFEGGTDLKEYAVGVRAERSGLLSAGRMTSEFSYVALKWLLARSGTRKELRQGWRKLMIRTG